MFIPQWIYTIVFFYYFWITVPNLFNGYNNQRDLIFTQMLPVRREDIVRSRILVTYGIQMLHILFGVIFGLLHNVFYGTTNYLSLDINAAFFGLIFIVYGGFNIVFLPRYFKTGYKYGKALLYSSIYAAVFALVIDLGNGLFPIVNQVFEDPQYELYQYIILIGGIVVYILLGWLTMESSVKKFKELL